MTVAGLPVTLLDTAGIRGDEVDEVEAIGIERSRVAAAGRAWQILLATS